MLELHPEILINRAVSPTLLPSSFILVTHGLFSFCPFYFKGKEKLKETANLRGKTVFFAETGFFLHKTACQYEGGGK